MRLKKNSVNGCPRGAGPTLAAFVERVPSRFTCKQCLVLFFLMTLASKFVHAILSIVLTQKYDVTQATYRVGGGVSGKVDGVDKWKVALIQRAYNAHQNSFEALTYFSAAVLMAAATNLSKDVSAEVDQLANAFLVARALYQVAYLAAFNEPLSIIRSATFGLAVSISVNIMFLAGGKFF